MQGAHRKGDKMGAIDELNKKELRELLCKNWMTHDAMWLLHCVDAFGMEKANQINKNAVLSMAMIEIKRIRNALGYPKEEILRFDDLKSLIFRAMEIAKADFMTFTWTSPGKNIIQWKWEEGSCFAYQGVNKLGVLDKYECGILTRIEGWLKGLGVTYNIFPRIDKCLMSDGKGNCEGKFTFRLE